MLVPSFSSGHINRFITIVLSKCIIVDYPEVNSKNLHYMHYLQLHNYKYNYSNIIISTIMLKVHTKSYTVMYTYCTLNCNLPLTCQQNTRRYYWRLHPTYIQCLTYAMISNGNPLWTIVCEVIMELLYNGKCTSFIMAYQ